MPERVPDVSDRTPVRADVDWTGTPDGRVSVRKRKFGAVGTRLLRMAGLKPDLTVNLDALGSRAWRLMDGRRTVADVLDGLREAFPHEEDLAPRLGRFLSTMVSNGLVRLEPRSPA